LEYDEKNYKKKYKLRFQLNSNTLSPSITNIYGVYLTGLSNNIKNGVINNNTDYYHFLGVLKPKLTKNMYMLEANHKDNEPVILEVLNHTSNIGVQIKNLTTTPITTLENGLIRWFKFQKDDFNGTSLYEYVSKTYIANALANGATYSTINPKIGDACLDLSNNIEAKVNAGNINFSGTNLFTITCRFRPNTNKIAYNILTDYRRGRYCIFGNNNMFNFQLDYDPTETNFFVYFNNTAPINVFTSKYGDTINNSWLHLAVVVGNLQPIKLYINGELLATGNNSSSVGNLGITIGHSGYGLNSQNRFNAWVADYRVYNRELSANEILTLYEQGGIDYELKLSLEEVN
jgi:hypothetical protein